MAYNLEDDDALVLKAVRMSKYVKRADFPSVQSSVPAPAARKRRAAAAGQAPRVLGKRIPSPTVDGPPAPASPPPVPTPGPGAPMPGMLA